MVKELFIASLFFEAFKAAEYNLNKPRSCYMYLSILSLGSPSEQVP